MVDLMTHDYEPDDDIADMCICGLPRGNRRHAADPAVLGELAATIAPLPVLMSRETLAAAKRALPGSVSVKGRVLTVIAKVDPRRGMTDSELAMAMPLVNGNSLRPRRIDLTHDGWLEQATDAAGELVSRGGFAAWRLSDAARIARASAAGGPLLHAQV